LVGMLASEEDCERIDEMSEGRKRFQTSSESAAERKILERTENVPTSEYGGNTPFGQFFKPCHSLMLMMTFIVHK